MWMLRPMMPRWIVLLVLLNARMTMYPMAATLGDSPLVLREFIFDEAPFPSCHATSIVECQGTLVAAWFGGTAERNPDVTIWISRRLQDGWTKPVAVADGVQPTGERLPTWNPVLFQPQGGPLYLFYKVGPNPQSWWGMVMTSSDGGQTWSAPHRLPNGILGPIKNKPVELPDGTILAGSSTEDQGWRVHFERSTNQGATWTATTPVNDGNQIAAIQPSILIHQDGRLQAVGRTVASGIFQIWSDDLGQSWGEMTSLGLPNPNSGTDAVTLADGRHVLVYNHSHPDKILRRKARNPLNVAISDDGLHWKAAYVLEDDPGKEFSYPGVIQSADKLIHITYSWQCEKIRHVVLDPTRFRSEPIVDGIWPSSIAYQPQHD